MVRLPFAGCDHEIIMVMKNPHWVDDQGPWANNGFVSLMLVAVATPRKMIIMCEPFFLGFMLKPRDFPKRLKSKDPIP